ncbi:hypothetical protein ACE1SV_70240 [Streptomyces sp. E-15]
MHTVLDGIAVQAASGHSRDQLRQVAGLALRTLFRPPGRLRLIRPAVSGPPEGRGAVMRGRRGPVRAGERARRGGGAGRAGRTEVTAGDDRLTSTRVRAAPVALPWADGAASAQ